MASVRKKIPCVLPQCGATSLVAVTVYPVKYFAARDCAPGTESPAQRMGAIW